MTSPYNPSKHPNPEWLRGGNPGAIEEQEADGQREMLRATTLPADMRGQREQFEALGFKFGEVVERDPLFIEATLPEGWKKNGTDHAMWTHIVDERDIERVSVFYKAAFYDRSAFMGIDNVGRKASGNYIYGDSDNIDTELFGKLTSEELAEAMQDVLYMKDRIKEYPDIYGKHLPRTEKLIEFLEKK